MGHSKQIFMEEREKEQDKSAQSEEHEILINMGKICPYCNQPTELVDNSKIYSSNKYPGNSWACFPCSAWVGCHEGSEESKGRLANSELRMWKKLAHEAFDPIWKDRHMLRNEAYFWLADQLKIKRIDTHIGCFDVEMCKRVVEVSKAFFEGKTV